MNLGDKFCVGNSTASTVGGCQVASITQASSKYFPPVFFDEMTDWREPSEDIQFVEKYVGGILGWNDNGTFGLKANF